MKSRMKSKARKQELPGFFFPLFFGVFALLGSIFFAVVAVWPIYNLVRAQSWIATPCRINTSEVEEHSGDDGYTYSIAITYSFEWGGQTYGGDRYDFSMGSSSGYDAKQRVVEAYPPDQETLCFVDPKDPHSSVISRKPGWYLLWGLIPLPFMAVGFGGLFWFFFFGRKKDGAETGARGGGRHRARSVAPTAATSTGLSSTGGGSQSLTPDHSPRLRFLIVLMIALVWNTFVAILIFTTVIPGFLAGDPEWFLSVFTAVLALVGLALITFTFYAFLSMFNPKLFVELDDPYLTLGETSTIRWWFEGRTNRISKLTFTLDGNESATYRRGTSSQTDHHTFYEQELLSTDHPGSIARGSFELQVPERSMPSFKSANNKIEWSVAVRGDIPRWPDVSEVLPLTVHPPSRGERA